MILPAEILPALFFYLFAGVCIASAFMVIASRNPVHSVLFLILTFVNAAGLFLLLGAEFLAMILIVVYVGAVAVLFLFVVMMLDVDFTELRQGFLDYLPFGAVIGLIFLIELVLVLFGWVVRAGREDRDRRADARHHHQHRGARAHPLHALHLLLPGGRAGAAGRHDRRDRAHPAPQTQRQAAEHLGAERAHARHSDRGPAGAAGAGDLKRDLT